MNISPIVLVVAVAVLCILCLAALWLAGKTRPRRALPIPPARPAGRAKEETPDKPSAAQPDQTPSTPKLDVLAPHLEVVRLVGEGGMGHVYEGFDTLLQRRVAIKRLRQEVRNDPVGKRQFLKEARITASLRHPNIVEIFSVLEAPGELCLIFEFVNGCTVEELIRRKGRLSLAQCRTILRGACAALEFAHSRQVLHKDLKPSNIMVAAPTIVKVMDFGIARQATTTLSRLSRGKICGTPSYMSPEQHLGQDTRSADYYSLAASLYKMLTGQVPFPGINPLTLKERLDFKPLSAHLRSLDDRADRFMAKALAPDPKQRFASAEDFLRGFEEMAAALQI